MAKDKKICPILVLSSTLGGALLFSSDRVNEVEVDNECLQQGCQWWGPINSMRTEHGCQFANKR